MACNIIKDEFNYRYFFRDCSGEIFTDDKCDFGIGRYIDWIVASPGSDRFVLERVQ